MQYSKDLCFLSVENDHQEGYMTGGLYELEHNYKLLYYEWTLESDCLTNVLRCAIIFRETHGERSSRQLSRPHYMTISLRQMISGISKVLQQKNNQNPQWHWPNKYSKQNIKSTDLVLVLPQN